MLGVGDTQLLEKWPARFDNALFLPIVRRVRKADARGGTAAQLACTLLAELDLNVFSGRKEMAAFEIMPQQSLDDFQPRLHREVLGDILRRIPIHEGQAGQTLPRDRPDDDAAQAGRATPRFPQDQPGQTVLRHMVPKRFEEGGTLGRIGVGGFVLHRGVTLQTNPTVLPADTVSLL